MVGWVGGYLQAFPANFIIPLPPPRGVYVLYVHTAPFQSGLWWRIGSGWVGLEDFFVYVCMYADHAGGKGA